MTERWWFGRDGETVVLRSRVEGDDGTIGDAFAEVPPGETAFTLTYQELFDAEAGVLGREGAHRHAVAAPVPPRTWAGA
jgi:hypothetical protein